MMATCPACGRKVAAAMGALEIVCDCGRRFDPSERPTVADPFLGAIHAGYRFEELIGSGGMGTVYRARQVSLDRDVAVKVLPPNVAGDPQFVQRFHREAEVLASLSHPNIVSVIDRGEINGRFFLVMEYVAGRNLRDCMRGAMLPPSEAVRVVAALLDALDYAHRNDVIHRDVKPENILISNEGIVKIADFGLSRVLGGATGNDTRLTRSHLVLGTYEYMAPEQREGGGAADGRADIFAAAVVLYELLTGELPIGRFHKPSAKTPELDRRLDDIVDRALAKDPDDRYAHASAMGESLKALLSMPGAPVTIPEVDLSNRKGRVLSGPSARRDPRHAPTRFEMRLDLLFTLLAAAGIILAVAGCYLLFDQHRIDLGLVELDPGLSGLVLLLYGGALWNAAERARAHWPGARTVVLALTAVAGLTLVAIPVTVVTWMMLLAPEMRRYTDARFRGASEVEAAALAQGYAIERVGLKQAMERRRKASDLNRRAAAWFCALSLGAFLVWAIGFKSHVRFKDEGFACFLSAQILVSIGFLFFVMARKVAGGTWLRVNAWIWTGLAFLSPKGASRARAALRDRRDGLL